MAVPALKSRTARLVVVALAIVLVYFAILLVPPWLRAVVPEPLERRIKIRLLIVLLFGHVALLAAAIIGTVAGLALVLRARKRRRPRRRSARLLALSCSTLFVLLALEGAAATWQRWAHRMPTLPEKFPFKAPDLPNRFDRGGDEVSIVVIGGSSAHGDMYDKWTSIGAIVAWRLGLAVPSRRSHVDVLAEPGASLELMHQKLAKLTRKPDLLIVYSGHNEFQARFSWLNIVPYYVDELPILKSRERLMGVFGRFSPLSGLIDETLEKHEVSVIPPRPPVNARKLIDHPMCTPEEGARLRDDFERRLEAIVGYCERVGCLPALVIPPGNDADYEPDRSVLLSTTSKAGRAAVTRRFQQVHTLESSDPSKAIAGYRAILAEQPTFAEAHYRLGRLLLAAGEKTEADREFVAARDCDGLPMRCTTPFMDAYRSVARRHDVVLVDGPAVFHELSPSGILDDHLFHDAHHPSLLGHIALAEGVLKGLHERGAFGWSKSSPWPAIDPVDVFEHFGVGVDQMAHICDRAATFYERTAFLRYDPSQRHAKARAFREAGRRIRDGADPNEVGITGLVLLRRKAVAKESGKDPPSK
ncbi:MAG TPA: tetratricopeptide repeat protein [Isosphaeraceae bacterium]|jgi:hypothetical protein|nr:tetratricopeptide repeat protein [Isosphaeraceae bacterium]